MVFARICGKNAVTSLITPLRCLTESPQRENRWRIQIDIGRANWMAEHGGPAVQLQRRS